MTPAQLIGELNAKRTEIRTAWDAAAADINQVCNDAEAAYLAATGNDWDCDRRPKLFGHAVLWDRCAKSNDDRDAITRPYRMADDAAYEKIAAIEEQSRADLLMLRGEPWENIREELDADPDRYMVNFVVPKSGYYADFSEWLEAMHRTKSGFSVPVNLTVDGQIVRSNTDNSLGICWGEVGGAYAHTKWTSDDFRG
jgi:hypothetical protein